MKNKISSYYSYIVYAVGCLAIALLAVHFNSNSDAVARVNVKQNVTGETIQKARQLVDSNFDFAAERELSNSVDQNSAPPVMDEVSTEVVKLNKENMERVFRGEPALKTMVASAEPLTSDIKQAWTQIEQNLKGTKSYLNGGAKEFKQALETYEKGMSLKQFPADEKGNIYLKEASRKFVQILKSKPHPMVKEYSMYFLGDIGFHLWDEQQDLPGAAYMIEVVRSTDNSDLAQKAWLKLNAQIHFGYTGSAGDTTPQTWKRFLAQLQGLTNKQAGFPLMSSTGH